MPKHLLEDMTKVRHVEKKTKEKEKPPKEAQKDELRVTQAKNRSRYLLWLVAFVSIVFFIFAISFMFSKAEIKVNPKIKEVVLNKNLSAVKNSNASDLSFDLIAIEGIENKNIQISGEKDVKETARGTVVIYNAFSSSPQSLNVDTRLEGSNGKIYKTEKAVIVPGKINKDTPGSVEVKIYAANAGTDYNSAPLDFTIVGFKGTSKYSKFYARSKGEITGGYKGKAPAITDSEKATALDGLQDILQTKLFKKASDQIPNGFILFKNATFFSADDANVPLVAQDNNLTITLKGTLYGLLFNEQKLAKKIAEDSIPQYDGSDVFISNLQDLTFSLFNRDSFSFDSVKNIDFNLSGSAKIVSKLDVNKFVGELLGKSKKDFNQILSQYGNIDSAILTLSPMWKMSIPDQAKNIKVIVNYPE